MNFGVLLKAFDTAMALREVVNRVKGGPAAGPTSVAGPPDGGLMPSTGGGLGTQIEARLTNVVMAALKEAFDRDHARLELERTQLDDQRRRAEEAMRQELRRQAADRELARLRMLAATALVGWIAAVAIFISQLSDAPLAARLTMAAGWLGLLGALAMAFSAQGRAGDEIVNGADARAASRPGTIAVWLLTGGLALSAISLVLR